MRLLLLIAFVGLLADQMFGWAFMLLPGVSLKNALLYLILIGIGIHAAIQPKKWVIELPQVHLFFILLLAISFLSWAGNTFVGLYVEYQPLPALMVWKSSALDHYLFFLLFFLGVRTRDDVIWLQKWVLFLRRGEGRWCPE